jgi:hypothetical protein
VRIHAQDTRVHDEIPVLGGQHLAADHVLGHGDRLAVARAQLSQVLDVLRPPVRPQQPDERANFLQGYKAAPLLAHTLCLARGRVFRHS